VIADQSAFFENARACGCVVFRASAGGKRRLAAIVGLTGALTTSDETSLRACAS
jgi:hypothetical protein